MSDKYDQMYHIPVDEPTLFYTTVTTSKGETEDHEPLYYPDGTTMREGFDVQTNALPLSSELVHRFRIKDRTVWLSSGQDNDGNPLPQRLCLELYCRFAMKHDNKSIEVGIEVLAPEHIPYKRMYSQHMPSTQQTDCI